jgi:hypothetical protein
MLDQYARLEQNGTERLVGYVEASGCLHLSPLPNLPIYDGRFFLVEAVVLEDIGARRMQARRTLRWRLIF